MKTFSRCLAMFGIGVALLTASSISAMANSLTGASATATCSGNSLTVNAAGLTTGTSYTIKDTLTATCNGTPAKFPGSINFKATGPTAQEMASETWSLMGACTVTGSATLTSSGSTVPIIINGSSSAALSCPTPSICSALGPAGNFAVLGLQGSIINLSSGPLRISGNLGIGQNGNFNFSGGGNRHRRAGCGPFRPG